MEYVEGVTLKEYIEQRRVIPWKEAVHFLTQILRALQHAHDRGVVHRDIKPQNIMLLHSGNIKVTDFGIARFSRSETRTMSENAIGSVHYISPEQARGDFTDEKADIYSIGVVLYEMLTGELPFQSDSTVSVAIMQLQSEPRRPREINDAIPLGLEQITIHAMQKDPAERYQSAAEMLLDLEEFKRNPLIRFEYAYYVDREPTKYVSPVDRQRASLRQPVPAQRVPAVEEEDETRSKLVPRMIGIVLGVLVLVAVVAFLIFNLQTNSNSVVVDNFLGKKYADILEKSQEYDAKYTINVVEESSSAAEPGYIFKQEPTSGSRQKPDENGKVKLTLYVAKLADDTVPRVVGMSINDAEAAIENAHFLFVPINEVNLEVEEGKVIRTEPPEGERLDTGKPVKVFIAVAEDPKNQVEVPSLLGWELARAKEMLESVGLVLDESSTPEEASTEEKGKVTWQSVEPKEKISKGTKIRVRISSGQLPTSTLSLTLNLPNRGGEGTLKVYLNNVKQQEATLLLNGSSHTITLEGAGSGQSLQITLDDGHVYSATVDFTKTPPALSNVQDNLTPTESPGILLPNVLGKTREDALTLLQDAGFTNIEVEEREPSLSLSILYSSGQVSGMSPSAQRRYPAETPITITVIK
jgi:serine/threonine-protein kinase